MTQIAIAVRGVSQCGKSTVIANFFDKIKSKGKKKVFWRNDEDLFSIVSIGTVKIGISSQGDPGSGLDIRLKKLVQKKCDIIICATRSYGNTVSDFETICGNYQQVFLGKAKTTGSKLVTKKANKQTTKLLKFTINHYFPKLL